MKLKTRVILIISCVIVFMVFVSFKILEPEFQAQKEIQEADKFLDAFQERELEKRSHFLPRYNKEVNVINEEKLLSPKHVRRKEHFNNHPSNDNVDSDDYNRYKNPGKDSYYAEIDEAKHTSKPKSIDKNNKNDYDERLLEEKDNSDNIQKKQEQLIKDSKLIFSRWLLKKYEVQWNKTFTESPWKIAESWVNQRRILLDHTPELGAVLRSMSRRTIIGADVGHRGTQLKLSLMLAGGQKVAFKPKWYPRDYIVEGTAWAGRDRHNGEIASFHISRLLGLNRSPPVVGRVVDLEKDIMPVATERLLQTFFEKDGNTCFLGKCLYCKNESDAVCAEGMKLEGAVVLWLPKQWSKFTWLRHPWGRTYRDTKAKWEVDNDYCEWVRVHPTYKSGPLLLDILDAAVFDYLIGNADRHHYETFKGYNDSMLIMLDSGKSFGNPDLDERSILAPLYQCCILRQNTYERLQMLRDGVLSSVLEQILESDPIAPVLAPLHYTALDRRLTHILDMVEDCIQQNGVEYVLLKDKYS